MTVVVPLGTFTDPGIDWTELIGSVPGTACCCCFWQRISWKAMENMVSPGKAWKIYRLSMWD